MRSDAVWQGWEICSPGLSLPDTTSWQASPINQDAGFSLNSDVALDPFSTQGSRQGGQNPSGWMP